MEKRVKYHSLLNNYKKFREYNILYVEVINIENILPPGHTVVLNEIMKPV